MMDRRRSLLIQGLRSGALLLVLMATITGQMPEAADAGTTPVSSRHRGREAAR